MHACALLLDELFSLIPEEERALEQEDLEQVELLAQRRSGLVDDIWRQRDGYDKKQLKQRLEELCRQQEHLRQKALALQQTLRQRQMAGRKQTRYFDGDRYRHAQSKRAFYCEKVT